jgi:hypothetical protein
MGKKSSLLVTAVIALALAVPSIAGASEIKDKTKIFPVPIGTVIKGTDVQMTVKGAFNSDVKCTAGALPFEEILTKNAGGVFELANNNNGELSAVCGSYPITRFWVPNMKSSVSGSGTMAMLFWVGKGGVGECHFEGTVPFTYTPGTNEFSISGSLTVLPKACAANPVTVTGSFTLSEVFMY